MILDVSENSWMVMSTTPQFFWMVIWALGVCQIVLPLVNFWQKSAKQYGKINSSLCTSNDHAPFKLAKKNMTISDLFNILDVIELTNR